MNAQKIVDELIIWIKDWFEVNGKGCKAIIGISGGKDSTIAAKLCVEALGADRVIGIMLPCGEQKDIADSRRVCDLLGIKSYTMNIHPMFIDAVTGMQFTEVAPSQQTLVNLPARIRMTMLYAYAQSLNGRVVNTCNLSEEIVGYSTRWGDSVGDFSPLGNLTVSELIQIGDYLKLPHELVHKTPIDGLNVNADGSYVTDEENLGVSYADIDAYIYRELESAQKLILISDKEAKNRFKREPIPTYIPVERRESIFNKLS